MSGSHTWTYLKKVLPDFRGQATWKIGMGKISCLDFCWLYDIHPPNDLKWTPLREALQDVSRRQDLMNSLQHQGKQALQCINHSNDPDQLIWERSGNDDFSTRAFTICVSSPWQINAKLPSVWHIWLPPRISVFLWRLFHRALATDDKIQDCGIPFASKCRCCAYPASESIPHLFIHSDFAIQAPNLLPHSKTPQERSRQSHLQSG
ncbi:hypothetical protein QQ045_008836 [Rhodiola kirilowii]